MMISVWYGGIIRLDGCVNFEKPSVRLWCVINLDVGVCLVAEKM